MLFIIIIIIIILNFAQIPKFKDYLHFKVILLKSVPVG